MEWIFYPVLVHGWEGLGYLLLNQLTVKCALKIIVYDRLFAEESLYTFFCEIESLLNCRVLTHISGDSNDYSVLTPNHILFCQESNNYSTDNFIDDEINLCKKWRTVQAAANMFF